MKKTILESLRWTVLIVCYILLAWSFFYAVSGLVNMLQSSNDYSADNLW